VQISTLNFANLPGHVIGCESTTHRFKPYYPHTLKAHRMSLYQSVPRHTRPTDPFKFVLRQNIKRGGLDDAVWLWALCR